MVITTYTAQGVNTQMKAKKTKQKSGDPRKQTPARTKEQARAELQKTEKAWQMTR